MKKILSGLTLSAAFTLTLAQQVSAADKLSPHIDVSTPAPVQDDHTPMPMNLPPQPVTLTVEKKSKERKQGTVKAIEKQHTQQLKKYQATAPKTPKTMQSHFRVG